MKESNLATELLKQLASHLLSSASPQLTLSLGEAARDPNQSAVLGGT